MALCVYGEQCTEIDIKLEAMQKAVDGTVLALRRMNGCNICAFYNEDALYRDDFKRNREAEILLNFLKFDNSAFPSTGIVGPVIFSAREDKHGYARKFKPCDAAVLKRMHELIADKSEDPHTGPKFALLDDLASSVTADGVEVDRSLEKEEKRKKQQHHHIQRRPGISQPTEVHNIDRKRSHSMTSSSTKDGVTSEPPSKYRHDSPMPALVYGR